MTHACSRHARAHLRAAQAAKYEDALADGQRLHAEQAQVTALLGPARAEWALPCKGREGVPVAAYKRISRCAAVLSGAHARPCASPTMSSGTARVALSLDVDLLPCCSPCMGARSVHKAARCTCAAPHIKRPSAHTGSALRLRRRACPASRLHSALRPAGRRCVR